MSKAEGGGGGGGGGGGIQNQEQEPHTKMWGNISVCGSEKIPKYQSPAQPPGEEPLGPRTVTLASTTASPSEGNDEVQFMTREPRLERPRRLHRERHARLGRPVKKEVKKDEGEVADKPRKQRTLQLRRERALQRQPDGEGKVSDSNTKNSFAVFTQHREHAKRG